MVVVVVVFVGECDFSRTSRKGRIFYIHKLADKRFSTCSLSVEDNDSLLRSTCITECVIIRRDYRVQSGN